MTKLGKVAVALAMAFSVGAALAAPIDVYVTVSGAGAKDGSSWDNAMKSITAAYVLCATNGNGGTVHLAGGFYKSTTGNFTAGAGIVAATNVNMVGETDSYGSTPVVITGDQGLNDYWSGDSTSKKIWASNTYHPPVGRKRNVAYSSNDSSFRSSAQLRNCTFTNIVFSGFNSYVMALLGSETLTFSRCRFLANGNNNTAHPSTPVLSISNAAVTMDACEFEGYEIGPVVSSTNNVDCVLTDCRFNSGTATGANTKEFSGGIKFTSKVRPLLYGCTFSRLYQYGGGANCSGAAAITLDCTRPVVLSNCVFSSCSSDGYSVGTVRLPASSVVVTIVGCVFSNNVCTVNKGGDYGHSACLSVATTDNVGSCRVRDTYFGRNKIVATAGGACGTVLGVGASQSHFFINCTFDCNCATGTVSSVGTIRGWRSQKVGFANCVFYGNDVFVSGVRKADLATCYIGDASNNNGAMFVNTIMWHEADDYKPFDLTKGSAAAAKIGVVSSDIKGYEPESAPDRYSNGFFYQPIVNCDPILSRELATNDICIARGLTADSPFVVRRKGIPVYAATNGYYYFLDTHKSPNVWRCIGDTSAGSRSLAQGEEVGLTVGMDPIPDAFGAPRKANAVAMGALNAPPRGLMINVK